MGPLRSADNHPALSPSTRSLHRRVPSWTPPGEEHSTPGPPARDRRISSVRGSASATFQTVSYLTRGRDSRALCCKCSKLRKSIYNLAKHRAFRPWRRGEGVTAGLRVARPLAVLGCETLEPWSRTTATQPAGFQSPIVLPSGSANQANVPVGIVTGGTSVLPPSDSALASAAGISSTWT
jgi:hypothetical protein